MKLDDLQPGLWVTAREVRVRPHGGGLIAALFDDDEEVNPEEQKSKWVDDHPLCGTPILIASVALPFVGVIMARNDELEVKRASMNTTTVQFMKLPREHVWNVLGPERAELAEEHIITDVPSHGS